MSGARRIFPPKSAPEHRVSEAQAQASTPAIPDAIAPITLAIELRWEARARRASSLARVEHPDVFDQHEAPRRSRR